MRRRIILGGLLGAGAYMLYQYERQKAVWVGDPKAGPLGVPLGNLVGGLVDPFFYGAIAAGAAAAWAVR